MKNDTQQIVNKAWNFAHVLRDDGLSYMAYTEQITFLLFLKMADEQTRPPYNRKPIVPPELGWQSLLARDGDELEVHYRHVLEELGKKPGMLGEIFKKARPEIQNPATLRRLIVDLIDAESWSSMQADVKGEFTRGCSPRARPSRPRARGNISRRGSSSRASSIASARRRRTRSTTRPRERAGFSWPPISSSPTSTARNSTRTRRNTCGRAS
jgi:type I restriction enzyme M protein